MFVSFWEKSHFNFEGSWVVLGAGFVGLSTAISLKERHPDQSVILLDRMLPGLGASTKNAGFLCFGSCTELLSDLEHLGEEALVQLIRQRWEGSQILHQRCGHLFDDAPNTLGGYEIFDQSKSDELDIILQKGNALMEKAIQISGYFQLVDQTISPDFSPQMSFTPYERAVNPVSIWQQLYQMATSLGVKFYIGAEVQRVDPEETSVHFKRGDYVRCGQIFITTNGFTKNICAIPDVVPARNIVGVTRPIPEFSLPGVYHLDEGYVYFRKVEDRLLIGGARNLDLTHETTDAFGTNEQIMTHLTSLVRNLCNDPSLEIDHWWSGILGVGTEKLPLIQSISPTCHIGVRLGGMGVAISSYIGQELTKFAAQN